MADQDAIWDAEWGGSREHITWGVNA